MAVSIELFQTCRICLATDFTENLISPCNCIGSIQFVHRDCLQDWLQISKNVQCEICKLDYNVFKKFKPFRQWIFPKFDFYHFFLYFSIIFLNCISIYPLVQNLLFFVFNKVRWSSLLSFQFAIFLGSLANLTFICFQLAFLFFDFFENFTNLNQIIFLK